MLFYLTDLLALGCINSIMVVGMNLQYGYTGILNVSLYIYTAIGAYVAGVTTMGKATLPGTSWVLGWTLPWYLGLLLGAIAAAVVGGVVFSFTVRRLRMDYLAIVTVATAFIVWNVIDNYYALFDGDTGLFNVPNIVGGGSLSSEQYSLVMVAIGAGVLAVFVWLSRRIFRSPFGRLLRAMREDETVTTAFGHPSWGPQLWVFIIGCFMAGAAGGLFIFYISAWSPAAFLPLESFVILAALIIGGSGNYWGAMLGAFIIIEGLNEFSRFAPNFGNPANAGAIRALLIGIFLILVLRYRPEGLFPERWLHWYGGGRGWVGARLRGGRGASAGADV